MYPHSAGLVALAMVILMMVVVVVVNVRCLRHPVTMSGRSPFWTLIIIAAIYVMIQIISPAEPSMARRAWMALKQTISGELIPVGDLWGLIGAGAVLAVIVAIPLGFAVLLKKTELERPW